MVLFLKFAEKHVHYSVLLIDFFAHLKILLQIKNTSFSFLLKIYNNLERNKN